MIGDTLNVPQDRPVCVDNVLNITADIKVTGEVTIDNGDNHVVAKNKLSTAWWLTLASILAGQATYGGVQGFGFGQYANNNSNNWLNTGYTWFNIGQDTTHGTTNVMTSLYTPIGGAPGTKCSSISCASSSSS